MSYFVNADESLHLAISADGLEWRALHELNPVLIPAGEVSSMRDPFIRVGSDKRFHLLATNGWASTSIVHAVSEDLLNWSEPQLVPVMSEVFEARNAWAPEFFVDDDTGDHIVVWSSAVGGDESSWSPPYRVRSETADQRVWCSVTPDFESWSPPRLWFDPGYTVIDASVSRHNGRWMMAFKDERGHNHAPDAYKGIRISGFDSPFGPFDPPSEIISAAPAEGPTFVPVATGMTVLFDHFLDGSYGGARLSRDRWLPLRGLSVPEHARHASVLQVDATVFAELAGAAPLLDPPR